MGHLHMERVTYAYENSTPVVKDITWTLQRGTFHSLVGRSGCGKTSLLKVASGLLSPTKGDVFYNDIRVTKPLRHAGIVFQSPTLLEWKTALENVLLPITLKRKSTAEEKERAHELLSLMKIENLADRYPSQLSGGQQSRVALARALIKKPSLLFLDEPFAALDALTKEELQQDLLTLCKKQQMTVLFVTHDITEAVFLSDYVTVMAEGRLISHIPIAFQKERTEKLRYSDVLTDYCARVRQALQGGEQH